jgi:MEDS: MEthanogen/methylotroph, DcmR Sensory domain
VIRKPLAGKCVGAVTYGQDTHTTRKGIEVLGTGRDHVAAFYESDADLADQVYEHLFGAEEPSTAILVASAEHRRLIADRMTRAGLDVSAAVADGSFVAVDARSALAGFTVGGWPDAAAFWQTMSPVVKRAEARPGAVRVFGEMVALLWDAGQADAAVELEALWNELAQQYSFSLLCAYPADARAAADDADDLSHVLAAHSAVMRAPSRN